MTDLAVYQEPTAALAVQPAPVAIQFTGAQALTEWVNAARMVAPLAESLARTSFVPKALQGKPHEVAAAILAGSEVGMAPMAALRSVDIIEGKPSFSAIALRGLVQANGHAIWVVESNDTRAVVRGQRRGSDHIEQSTWTIDRAKKAGLAGKSNWQKNPAAMLVARASGEVSRLVAADVIGGMPYSSEELIDGVGADDIVATATAETDAPPAGVRRMSRRKPEPQPEPAHAAEEPAEDPTPQGISKPQMGKLQAGFKDLGIDDRTDRLNIVSTIVGRDIASASDLSMREASEVIDRLERAADQSDPVAWLMGVNPDTAEVVDGGVFDNPGYEPETDES